VITSWLALVFIVAVAFIVIVLVTVAWRAAAANSLKLHSVSPPGTHGVRLPNPHGVSIMGHKTQGLSQLRVTVSAIDRGTSTFTMVFCLRPRPGGVRLMHGGKYIGTNLPSQFNTPAYDAHLVLQPPRHFAGVAEKLPVPLVNLTKAGRSTCHPLGQITGAGIGNQRAFPLDWYEFSALASLRLPRGIRAGTSRVVPIGVIVFSGQNVLTASLSAGQTQGRESPLNLGFVIIAGTPYYSELFVGMIVLLPLALVVAIIILTARKKVGKGEAMVAVAVAPFVLLALRDQILPHGIQTRTLVDYSLLAEEALAVGFIAVLASIPFMFRRGPQRRASESGAPAPSAE
jgi:hypothetical protein